MAHRILHQITSHVSKAPLLKGQITLRSSSPQNESTISRSLNYSCLNSVLLRSKNQHSCCSTPTLLQSCYNPNFKEIRERSQNIDDDKNKEGDEEPQVDLVHVQDNSMNEEYLHRYKKSLEDSDYPKQTAKEFPLNKRAKSVSARPQGLKLDEEIVNLMRTKSEYNRLNHRVDFQEVEEQADIKYQTALRKMHKIGQKINTNQYKIDIRPKSKLVRGRSNLKNEHLHHVIKSLQPSNLTPFGNTSNARETEKYKSIIIETKPKIEEAEMNPKHDVPRPLENIRDGKEESSKSKQHNTPKKQIGADEFTDQMKMLEPNYEPQKRYMSLNRKLMNHEEKLPIEEYSKLESDISKSDFKACQSIINELKSLNPDYKSHSNRKNNVSDSALIQSTTALIKDYRSAVLDSRIDILNDTLYHTIKARQEKNQIQKSTPIKKSTTSAPIKVRVGSKFDLQQCSFPPSKIEPRNVELTPHEKVLVPWPSLSDRRKYSMSSSSSYTDVHNNNVSVIHLPMEMKVSKHSGLKWKLASKKPTEEIPALTRAYSTKSNMELLKILEDVPAKNAKSNAQANEVKVVPKFNFNGKVITIHNKKLDRNVTACGEQTKSQILQRNSTTKGSKNISFTEHIASMKDQPIFDVHGKICGRDTKIPKFKLPNLPFAIKKQKYVHQVGNTSIESSDLKHDNLEVGKIPNVSKINRHLNNAFQKSSLKIQQAKPNQIQSGGNSVKLSKTSTSSLPIMKRHLSVDMSHISTEPVYDHDNVKTRDTARIMKKTCKESACSLRNARQPTTTDLKKSGRSARVLKRDAISNQEAAKIPIPIIGKVKIARKVSAANLSSCTGLVKKVGSPKINNVKANEVGLNINTIASHIVHSTAGNKNISLKRLNRTADGLISNQENKKMAHQPLKRNVILNSALGKHKADTMTELSNLKTQDVISKPKVYEQNIAPKNVGKENMVQRSERKNKQEYSCLSNDNIANKDELRSFDIKNKSFKSSKFANQITNNYVNAGRKLNVHSALSAINDIAVIKSNFTPFIRSYGTNDGDDECDDNILEYSKRVPMKRLKKRPGFEKDFPADSNWQGFKHCQTLCAQMANLKMDKMLDHEKKKTLPIIKRSNCPCIENYGRATDIKMVGPKKRADYIVEEPICRDKRDSDKCLEKDRADHIARYEIKKKKLPVLLPKTPCFTTVSSNRVLLETQNSSTTTDKKSVHTTIPLLKQQSKTSTKRLHGRKNLSSKHDMAKSKFSYKPNIKDEYRRISPYLSYSEYRLSKSKPGYEMLVLDRTPEYLQPNCRLIGPTFAIEPPSPNTLNNDVTRGENFSKIPKPRITELNKYAIATTFASQQSIATRIESKSPNRNSFNAYKHIEPPVKEILSAIAVNNARSLAQEPVFEDLEKEARVNVEEAANPSLVGRTIPHDNLGEVSEHVMQIPKSSAMELHSATLLSEEDVNSSIHDKNTIVPSQDTLNIEANTNGNSSLWDRITNYLKAKIEDFVEVQEEKLNPDLLLCSGDEPTGTKSKNRMQSKDICENYPLQNTAASKTILNEECLNKTQDCSDKSSEEQTVSNQYQHFCKEYDALIQTLKEKEDAFSAMENCDTQVKLKSSIQNSKQVFQRNNSVTFSMQSRSYSNRCPKAPHDLIEYFKKIEQEKASNIDEDELESNILTAIKVGMDVMKKSKLYDANDIWHADILNHLDPISKAELQSLNYSTGDLNDSYLLASGGRMTNILHEDNKDMVNNLQEFRKNMTDIHNCSVLEYEESERKKTEDVQYILDEILKRNAAT